MPRCHLLAGAAAPCLLAVPAAAQTIRPSSDIVVTATRLPQPLADVPASVSVVTAGDIADTPARTIDDVLRRLPSVDLPLASTNEQHPTDTIVSMRGLSGIRSLVLLDGVPLNDSFFGYVQWGEVPLDTIDRVEVVRGGGAPLWGNYAMGGVINILTRPIERSQFDAKAAGGNRGTGRVDGHAAYAGSGSASVSTAASTTPTGISSRQTAIAGRSTCRPRRRRASSRCPATRTSRPRSPSERARVGTITTRTT